MRSQQSRSTALTTWIVSSKIKHIMQSTSDKADWLSFILHFVFGLVVGCILGFVTISRRRHGIWLQEELILPYLSGTSLIVAGFGARMGDRLWVGNNYRIIPPNGNRHSRFSLFVATISIVIGVCLSLVSLYRHFS